MMDTGVRVPRGGERPPGERRPEVARCAQAPPSATWWRARGKILGGSRWACRAPASEALAFRREVGRRQARARRALIPWRGSCSHVADVRDRREVARCTDPLLEIVALTLVGL